MNKNISTSTLHILPLNIYFGVACVLLVFTVITVYIASHDFGPYNLVIAMLIAAVKASLVALFFMHLRYDNKLYMIIFVAALAFLAVFIILTMFDTLRRDDIYSIEAQPLRQNAAMYDSLRAVPHGEADTTASIRDSIAPSSHTPAH